MDYPDHIDAPAIHDLPLNVLGKHTLVLGYRRGDMINYGGILYIPEINDTFFYAGWGMATTMIHHSGMGEATWPGKGPHYAKIYQRVDGTWTFWCS